MILVTYSPELGNQPAMDASSLIEENFKIDPEKCNLSNDSHQ